MDFHDFPIDLLQEIKELPRETVVADFCTLVKDLVCRVDHYTEFSKQDGGDYPMHSTFVFAFLTDLGAVKEALPLSLEYLRLRFSDIELYCGDFFEEDIFWFFSQAVKEDSDEIKSYLLEYGLDGYSKARLVCLLSDIALQDDVFKPKFVEMCAEVLQSCLAQPNQLELIDSSFISSVCIALCSLRAIDKWHLIVGVDKHEWLDHDIAGDLSKLSKKIQSAAAKSNIKHIPTDIFDFFRPKVIKDPSAEFISNLRITDAALKSAADLSLLKQMLDSRFQSKTLINKLADTVLTSRNALCACGSGKKYKRCCGK
jgi:SEC-C motif